MTKKLPQKYQEVAKALIPYQPREAHQLALIQFDPALPCILCGRPATTAIIAPAPEHSLHDATPWLTFPICDACEERQIRTQSSSENKKRG